MRMVICARLARRSRGRSTRGLGHRPSAGGCRAASGVDGVTWQDYEADWGPTSRACTPESNAARTGCCPSSDGFILKQDDKQRPLRIWLVRFLEYWIGEERVIRLVRKWLKAGVLDNGAWSVSETWPPQGAVASPLLANGSICTRTRPACWSSVASRWHGSSGAGWANQRRSTSWASPSSAASLGVEPSRSTARHGATA